MIILPKAIYRFNEIPINIHMLFFTELKQIIQKFTWNHKRTQIAKATLWKRTKLAVPPSQISDYTTKATVIKTTQYWHKNKHIDQWTESPVINPHTIAWLIQQQRKKNIQCRKDSLFNKGCWRNWTAMCKTMRLEYYKNKLTMD